jgi:hypothetical protein
MMMAAPVMVAMMAPMPPVMTMMTMMPPVPMMTPPGLICQRAKLGCGLEFIAVDRRRRGDGRRRADKANSDRHQHGDDDCTHLLLHCCDRTRQCAGETPPAISLGHRISVRGCGWRHRQEIGNLWSNPIRRDAIVDEPSNPKWNEV